MDNREIMDGDVRSTWLPRTPETRILQAPEIQEITGLSIGACRRLTRRFGFKCGARNFYITERRLMDALEQLQKERGEL